MVYNFIEIPIFLVFFAFILSDSVYINMLVYRICYADLGYNKSECALLGTQTPDAMTYKLEKLAEPHASVINMTSMVIQGFLCAVIVLFVGPWSDKFGRKPVLIVNLAGYVTAYGLYVILCFIPDLSAWIFLINIIPIILTGGFACFLTASLAYITDLSDVSNRGVRMAIFEVTIVLGIFFGNLLCSYIFSATGYPVVYGISMLSVLLALLYVIFFLQESVAVSEDQNRIEGFFETSHIMDMAKTTFRRREGYNRAIILICVIMLSIYILIINGQTAVSSLFLRNKFKWSLKACTMYQSFHNVVYILGTFFGVYFLHKCLKIPESILILIGFISMMNCALVTGFAVRSWQIYMGGVISCLGGVLSPMVRSLVSKVTPSDEIGKIFALTVASESVIGLIGSPLYTEVYNETLFTFPEMFNYLTAGLYLLLAIFTMIVLIMQNKASSSAIHYQNLTPELDTGCDNTSEIIS